jgi:hypothetical protein
MLNFHCVVLCGVELTERAAGGGPLLGAGAAPRGHPLSHPRQMRSCPDRLTPHRPHSTARPGAHVAPPTAQPCSLRRGPAAVRSLCSTRGCLPTPAVAVCPVARAQVAWAGREGEAAAARGPARGTLATWLSACGSYRMRVSWAVRRVLTICCTGPGVLL